MEGRSYRDYDTNWLPEIVIRGLFATFKWGGDLPMLKDEPVKRLISQAG